MMRIALLMLLITFSAHAEEWRMLDDSELLFEASWEGTALPGRFSEFRVELETESGALEGGRLTVFVDLAASDMDDPDINEAIVGDEWFGVATYPQARFHSASISDAGPGKYLANGDLDLKGVTRSVDVPFTWSESDGVAEMRGELIINRTQFDVGSGEWASDESIGTDVRVIFKVLLARQ